MNEPGPSLSAGDNLGRYEVVEEVGQGGFGRVYRVFDKTLDVTRALKVFKPAPPFTHTLVAQEARALARSDSPHITRAHDIVQVDESHVGIVMDFVDGETLREHVDVFGPQPPSQVAEWVVQLLDAVASLHAIGFIHHDLKPENVMIDEANHVRVLDLGLGRHLSEVQLETSEAQVRGSPRYIAPEVWRGKKPTTAVDLWGVGLLSCDLLSYQAFIATPSLRSFVDKVQHAPLAPLSDSLPFELKTLVESLLRRDPRLRPSAEIARDVLTKRRFAASVARVGLQSEAPARPFVGRRKELVLATAVARSALCGEGGLLVCRGPTGSGKSAFIQEIISHLASLGPAWLGIPAGSRPLAFSTLQAVRQLLIEPRLCARVVELTRQTEGSAFAQMVDDALADPGGRVEHVASLALHLLRASAASLETPLCTDNNGNRWREGQL